MIKAAVDGAVDEEALRPLARVKEARVKLSSRVGSHTGGTRVCEGGMQNIRLAVCALGLLGSDDRNPAGTLVPWSHVDHVDGLRPLEEEPKPRKK